MTQKELIKLITLAKKELHTLKQMRQYHKADILRGKIKKLKLKLYGQ